jgi:CheY-like chemotaxis protein
MLDTTLTTARILIVDDNASNVLLLEGILQGKDLLTCFKKFISFL